jgi:general secretion pathway protein G
VKGLMKKVSKGEGGFTLIELLIVIIILGILAAVVAFNVGGFLGAGTCDTAKTQKASLETAVIAAMADHEAGSVTVSPNPIGSAGDSQTKASAVTLTLGGTDYTLDTYLQGDIKGMWTFAVNSTGVVIAGTYSGGGKTAIWDNVNWTGDACT